MRSRWTEESFGPFTLIIGHPTSHQSEVVEFGTGKKRMKTSYFGWEFKLMRDETQICQLKCGAYYRLAKRLGTHAKPVTEKKARAVFRAHLSTRLDVWMEQINRLQTAYADVKELLR